MISLSSAVPPGCPHPIAAIFLQKCHLTCPIASMYAQPSPSGDPSLQWLRKWIFWSFIVRAPFGILQVYAGETVQVHEKTLKANYE